MFDKNTIIAIGSDHAGFEMKQHLLKVLPEDGYKFKDYGTFSLERVDYPDIAHAVAGDIANGSVLAGILICGSGNGISIAANKHPDVRCALCWNKEIAVLARKHNNANIISLPGRFLDFAAAADMVRAFFDTEFEGGRHSLRVNKINLNCGCGC
ncbi:MAG: ribose 5-phosphate isomerase B [Bacteroidales bacterium]|jgi:ribose 5-phosphate isomerase B|nr:ribose 5-phosphate isomerase B [Bacteroidales bacterium]